jgi:nucleoside-diphosphate-sugar epimerase
VRRSRSQRVLVTGATGFIGRTLCRVLADQGFSVRGTTRGAGPKARPGDDGVTFVIMGDLAAYLDWRQALVSCDVVVHLAARVHAPSRKARDPLREYERVNGFATASLVEQAVEAGVKRFVFLSTTKVYGDSSRRPFREADTPAPGDMYAASKLEAERAIAQIAAKGHMDFAILRPPLVYGPGVKANFLALMRAIRRGWPLPFASIRNRRSLIYVGNLADAVVRCIESPAAMGKTFLVSDGPARATPELCAALGNALGRPVRLFPFPPALLEFAPPLRKLTRSFEVDESAIRRELNWTPPYTFEEAIRATAEWYLREGGSSRG